MPTFAWPKLLQEIKYQSDYLYTGNSTKHLGLDQYELSATFAFPLGAHRLARRHC